MSQGEYRSTGGQPPSMTDPRQRTISYALQSLRSTIERYPALRNMDSSPEYRDAWKRAVLRIESLRVSFSAAVRYVRNRHSNRLEAAAAELRGELINLMNDDEFLNITEGMKFRYVAVNRNTSGLDLSLFEPGLTVPGAVAALINIAGDVADYAPADSKVDDVRQLRRIVPGQKMAPVQFTITNGRLAVAKQPAETALEDATNARASREALISSGERIIEELRRSNCDKRLLESIAELQEILTLDQNIIQLGLINIGCEAISVAFQAELPDALLGMLHGQTRGIAMHVAQFSEWQRFSENAASVQLGVEDVATIAGTATQIITALDANPAAADPEVPRTIATLRHLIADPAVATKRAAYAMLRTLENLVAKVFEVGGAFIDNTMTKTLQDLSTVISKTVVITLMTIALGGAATLTPLGAKISDTAWMKIAAEIVEKQIAILKN
jgi:hypothetical protein